MENCLQQWLMQRQNQVFLKHQSRTFCATRKCNTKVHHFWNQKYQHVLQQKFFVAKNVEISDCKNGGLPCCTSVLHKMSDFGVARKLDFVVAWVIVTDNSPLNVLFLTKIWSFPRVFKLTKTTFNFTGVGDFFSISKIFLLLIYGRKKSPPPPVKLNVVLVSGKQTNLSKKNHNRIQICLSVSFYLNIRSCEKYPRLTYLKKSISQHWWSHI